MRAPDFRTPAFLAFSIFLMAAPPALADGGKISGAVCGLREPSLPEIEIPEDGIDLDSLVSFELARGESFSATIAPAIELDWDSFEEITNLTPAPAGGKSLVFGPSRQGYEVLDHSELEGGLGASASFLLGNDTSASSQVFGSVGLIPLKGRETQAVRHYKSLAEVENRDDPPKLGLALGKLGSMRTGDSLTYVAKGGVMFWAGAGIELAGFTAAGLAIGEFEVRIHKAGEGQAYVKITESELESFGLQVGNLLVSTGVANYSRHARAMGFLLDVRDPTARSAFHDLVRGNVAPVQRLAVRGGNSGPVRLLDDAELSLLGESSQFRLGVPLLFKMQWSKSRYYETERRRLFSCGRVLDTKYGVFYRRYQGELFGVEQQFTRAFYGKSYAVESGTAKTAKRPIARGFGGRLMWSYRGDDVQPRTLRKAMERISENTGLEEVVLGVPEEEERVGFSAIDLSLDFTPGNTRNMITRARQYDRGTMAGMGRGLTKSYAASRSPETVCELTALMEGGSNRRASARECEEELTSRTEAAAESMIASLLELGQALRKGDEKRATRAYAEFGEAMLTNQFTFRLGLQLAGEGLRASYVVRGSDFHLHTSRYRTSGETGRLVPESR